MGGSRKASLTWAAMALGLAALAMASSAMAQSPASSPGAAEDCTLVITQLVDCLPFVAGTTAKPVASCCSNLTAVVDNAPTCLCQLYNATFTGPLGVNVTRAQQLPPACNVTTPSPSLCSLFGVPVPSPISSTSPAPAPTAPTASAPTPSEVPSPSPTPVTSSVSPAPSSSVSAPSASVPSSSNVTTASPPPPPSSAPVAAYSFSAATLLLVHLLVHS